MKSTTYFKKSGSFITIPLPSSSIWHYLIAVFIVILSSGICFFFVRYIGYQSVSFILLFVVSILSIFMGIGPITLASTLSAIIWNFFFIPPKFTIEIEKTEDVLMFGMFFIVALVNGVLTSRIRKQERLTRDREARTNALYKLTKDLSDSNNMNDLIGTAKRNIRDHFDLDATFILQDGSNNISEFNCLSEEKILSSEEMKIAESVFKNSLNDGKHTEFKYQGTFTFFPLGGRNVRPGVLAIKNSGAVIDENDEFWNTFLTQISIAVEREFLNDLARKARFLDESDKLYKTLFNSISHELRIPVATIISASESLLTTSYSEEIQKELAFEVLKASARLDRLINNLLNMSRLESGHISIRLDWYDVHDLINKVTDNLRDELKPFNLTVKIADDMPFVRIDFGLIEQVLYNLLYNATQYANNSSDLGVFISYSNSIMRIEVIDKGPGFPEKDLPLIFNKFHRVDGSKTGGTGLGLSIAKGFTEAHKGTITVENRPDGGAKFTIMIPSERPDMEIQVKEE
jgi:two-component system sensor histidine kinase KdpD